MNEEYRIEEWNYFPPTKTLYAELDKIGFDENCDEFDIRGLTTTVKRFRFLSSSIEDTPTGVRYKRMMYMSGEFTAIVIKYV
jgi:hypothetical protein